MQKNLNPEFDYKLEEVLKMKWNKEGFVNGMRKHWLGGFDGDTHMAYNSVVIYEIVKSKYGFKEVSYKIEINADYYGESGTSIKLGDVGLKNAKQQAIKLIQEAYESNKWFMKKANLQ